jgi:nucleotide-binding universal stress UspA family protein
MNLADVRKILGGVRAQHQNERQHEQAQRHPPDLERGAPRRCSALRHCRADQESGRAARHQRGAHTERLHRASESEFLDPEFQDRLRERAKSDARTKLDEEVEKIKSMGGKVAEAHTAAGRPGAEIVKLAEELGAGLVVLGSRGFGALKRAPMGSISNSVVRHAHGSVLIVGDEDPATQEEGRG